MRCPPLSLLLKHIKILCKIGMLHQILKHRISLVVSLTQLVCSSVALLAKLVIITIIFYPVNETFLNVAELIFRSIPRQIYLK